MLFGNLLVTTLGFEDSNWKYFVYIFPPSLGQGIVYPAMLFTSLATFDHADHAVTASTVYLIRSLGTVWGVAVTSAIVQTTLSMRLPEALGDIPDKERVRLPSTIINACILADSLLDCGGRPPFSRGSKGPCSRCPAHRPARVL